MPRLNHKKARTGCQRCKARKVKCDEGKPKCIACTRHNVPCEYVEPAPRRSDVHQQSLPSAQAQPDSFTASSANPELYPLDARLEVQLMRQWNKLTSQSFSPEVAFWRDDVILLAMDHRMLLDAIYALSALHASRSPPEQWVPLADRAVNSAHPSGQLPTTENGTNTNQEPSLSAVQTVTQPEHQSRYSREMLHHARRYFDRAITGHTSGIHNLSRDNIDAVYHTSILLSLVALFALAENDDDPSLLRVDPLFWTRLAEGIRYTAEISRQMVGDQVVDGTQISLASTTLPAAEDLFQQEQGKPFEALLIFGLEHEPPAPDDRLVYQQAVTYLAFMYKNITENIETPLTNCWRIIAMPCQLSRRLGEMIEYKTPRALTILAYMFALMKLAAKDIPWFQGIAERQVPLLDQSIPPAWKELLRWPMEVALGVSVDPVSVAEIEVAKSESAGGSTERLEDQVFRDLLTRDPVSSYDGGRRVAS